jgi:predicted histone-like DNA-binding protein
MRKDGTPCAFLCFGGNQKKEVPLRPQKTSKKHSIMAVKFVTSAKGNALKPEEPKRWYATAKSSGEISLKAVGKQISQRSTVNHADTLAVLEALTQVLAEQLAEGKIVRLGDLGSFQVNVGSEGAQSPDKLTASSIKTRKITFRPGAELKETLSKLTFERV